MLDLIRKKQRSVLIKFVFWAIIATFVGTIFLVWGKGSDQASEDPTVAATVNDTRISYSDYQRVLRNLYNLYQQMYRDQFTPAMEQQLGLRRQALDMLIDEALLLEEANRRNIEVSRQELVDSIAKIPAFQENGAFSRDRYLQALAAQRLTPEEFEKAQERQLLVDKVRQQIQQEVKVDEKAVAQEFRERNEKVNLAFIRLSGAEFQGRVNASPERLQEWFGKNREQFRQPETYSLKYVVFDPSAFEGKVTVEEDELEKHYRRNLDKFDIPEQAKVAHILFRVPENAPAEIKQKKKEEAEKVLEAARKGGNFAELARKHSEDTASAARGGDLGSFPRGTMVGPFEDAAFGLKPGQVSNIVETPFGFHIIKSEGYTEPGIRPLAEVQEEVKAMVRTEKARQLAYEKAMDAYNINRKGGSLEAAAKANALQVKETGLIGRQGAIEGLSNSGEIVASASALEPGQLGRPVALKEGVVLYALKERRESRLPELAEVRAEAEASYRQSQARELAKESANQALAAVKSGKPLSQVAAGLGLRSEETGFFTRAEGAFIPRLGSAGDLAKTAFTLTREKPIADKVFEQDGRFIVAALKDRQEADMTALDPTRSEEVRQSLLSRKRNEALENRVQELRKKAEITIAPAVASTLEGEKK